MHGPGHRTYLSNYPLLVLQDPSVAASPVENRIAFLQSKNLTQEEVNAALARAASENGTAPPYAPPPSSSAPGQPQPYYGQYSQQYPPYAWQAATLEPPRRDWRDWFIMATVVSGVGYGLYSLGKVSSTLAKGRLSPVI